MSERIVFGLDMPGGGGKASGHFINDIGASIEDCADWIVRRYLKMGGFESSLGWTVALWIDGKVAYEHTYK
jgi:hypothetical protein